MAPWPASSALGCLCLKLRVQLVITWTMEAAVGHPPAVETLHLEIVTTFYRTLSRISTKNWVMARFLKYPLK